MLQKLSYVNIFFAIIYLLVYLKSGTFNSTAGIFMIIVFSWLALRSYQLEDYKWQIWHYFTGGWCLYYIGTLAYGSLNILKSVIEFNFAGSDTLIFLSMSFALVILVLGHLITYFTCNLKNKKT